MKRTFYFLQTRSMIRDILRKKYGNKGLRKAWQAYQKEESGKPKIATYIKTLKRREVVNT